MAPARMQVRPVQLYSWSVQYLITLHARICTARCGSLQVIAWAQPQHMHNSTCGAVTYCRVVSQHFGHHAVLLGSPVPLQPVLQMGAPPGSPDSVPTPACRIKTVIER